MMVSNPKDGYYTNHSYARPSAATAWRVETRPESGTYLRTVGGTLLCRIADGSVYLWDKYERREIEISINHLANMAANV